MRRATLVFCLGLLGCDAGDPIDGDDIDDKADRPSSTADRGEIEIGTSRRARFTEPGQAHTFRLRVAANAVVEVSAYPIASQEKTLKTTIQVFGPLAADGTAPRTPLARTDDGSFAIRTTLAAAGEYRLVVAAATRRMMGSYDLDALCTNHACHPEPVTLTKRQPDARLAHAGEELDCGSGCFGEVHAYAAGGAEDPSAAAVTESVLRDLSQGDEDWSALDVLAADELGPSFNAFVAEAARFAGSEDVEVAKVNGLVQIPLGDYGTDGFDQDVYVLHYPEKKVVVALLVKD